MPIRFLATLSNTVKWKILNDALNKNLPGHPSSKNPSFADLDRLKLAGEVFAYLAVPVYSVEK